MERREFFTVAGAVAVDAMRNVEWGMRNWTVGRRFRIPNSAFRIGPSQEPSLSPEVFARRLDRARAELRARGLQCLIATPGTNYDREPDPRDWRKPFVSANDGGSGVALMMELAHHMKDLKARVGVAYAFFAGE